jgi:hypothetical protein
VGESIGFKEFLQSHDNNANTNALINIVNLMSNFPLLFSPEVAEMITTKLEEDESGDDGAHFSECVDTYYDSLKEQFEQELILLTDTSIYYNGSSEFDELETHVGKNRKKISKNDGQINGNNSNPNDESQGSALRGSNTPVYPPNLPLFDDCSLTGCCLTYKSCVDTCLETILINFRTAQGDSQKATKNDGRNDKQGDKNNDVLPPVSITSTFKLYSNTTISINLLNNAIIYPPKYATVTAEDLYANNSAEFDAGMPQNGHKIPPIFDPMLKNALCSTQCGKSTKNLLRNGNTYQNTPFIRNVSDLEEYAGFKHTSSFPPPSPNSQDLYCTHNNNKHLTFILFDLINDEAELMQSGHGKRTEEESHLRLDQTTGESVVAAPTTLLPPPLNPLESSLYFVHGLNGQSCNEVCTDFGSFLLLEQNFTSFFGRDFVQKDFGFKIFDLKKMYASQSKRQFTSLTDISPLQCYESLFPLLTHAISSTIVSIGDSSGLTARVQSVNRNRGGLKFEGGDKGGDENNKNTTDTPISNMYLYYSNFTTQPYTSLHSPLFDDYNSSSLCELQTRRQANLFFENIPKRTKNGQKDPNFHHPQYSYNIRTIPYPPLIFSPYSSTFHHILDHMSQQIDYNNNNQNSNNNETHPHKSNSPSPSLPPQKPQPDLHLVTFDLSSETSVGDQNTHSMIGKSQSSLFGQYDCRSSSSYHQRICPCFGNVKR